MDSCRQLSDGSGRCRGFPGRARVPPSTATATRFPSAGSLPLPSSFGPPPRLSPLASSFVLPPAIDARALSPFFFRRPPPRPCYTHLSPQQPRPGSVSWICRGSSTAQYGKSARRARSHRTCIPGTSIQPRILSLFSVPAPCALHTAPSALLPPSPSQHPARSQATCQEPSPRPAPRARLAVRVHFPSSTPPRSLYGLESAWSERRRRVPSMTSLALVFSHSVDHAQSPSGYHLRSSPTPTNPTTQKLNTSGAAPVVPFSPWFRVHTYSSSSVRPR